MPLTLTFPFPLYYTSFYNEPKETKEKVFLSEDEIDIYILNNKVGFSILNHEKKNIFLNKILSKKMLKQSFENEFDKFIGEPTAAISKNQIVEIFNKIYNKYYNTSYLLENE